MLNFLLDIIFPPLCVNCGANVQSPEVMCKKCLETIPLETTFFCGKCRARLPYGKRICHIAHPYLLGAATDYGNPAAKNLIHALKFEGLKRAAIPLARLLAQYAANAGFLATGQIVVPVPLGKNRERSRGYNQAAEIARLFAEHFQLAYEEKYLIRTRNTRPQTELHSPQERAQNVKDCFGVGEINNLRGKRIILIDDVTTSGATFFAAALALKAAGARSILALAAAKA
jgi:ComF family protein